MPTTTRPSRRTAKNAKLTGSTLRSRGATPVDSLVARSYGATAADSTPRSRSATSAGSRVAPKDAVNPSLGAPTAASMRRTALRATRKPTKAAPEARGSRLKNALREGLARRAPPASEPMRVALQYGTQRPGVPGPRLLRRWVRAAHAAGIAARSVPRRQPQVRDGGEVCVRVVGRAESHRLDLQYRGKDQPTNVLSFPASSEERAGSGALGDIVMCASVIATEARQQGKPLAAHWAHMVVHGTLHLVGFHHEKPRATRRMEGLEVEILRGLGFHDPYLWSRKTLYE